MPFPEKKSSTKKKHSFFSAKQVLRTLYLNMAEDEINTENWTHFQNYSTFVRSF